MSAADFRAWLALMKLTRGWSKEHAARELGCGAASIYNWARRGAPAYIGLACSALDEQLPAWTFPPRARRPQGTEP